MKLLPVISAALIATGTLFSLNAQSVTTDPVGYVTKELLPASDNYFAPLFDRPAVFVGTIESVNGSDLTLNGASFDASQLIYAAGTQPNTYFIRITSGPAQGHFSTITAHTSSAVSTEFEQDILNALAAGDSVSIKPYWTLGTLFPDDKAGVYFEASTSNFAGGRRTEVRFPDLTSAGIDKSPSSTYFFNGYWRLQGAVAANRNDTVILPDSYLIIRTNNSSDALDLVVSGNVNLSGHVISLASVPSSRNDNPIAVPIPIAISLIDLNLVGDNMPFVVSTSNFAAGRGDELRVFVDGVAGIDRAPSATYFFNDFWRLQGSVAANQNETLIPAGAAILIRKQATAMPEISDWFVNLNLD